MATKKIILDFKQQPIVGTYFKYKIYINGVILTYLNTLSYVNISYKAGGNSSPFQIGLGTDLNDTIDKTLTFLNSTNYLATSSSGGYLTTVSYQRIDDTIEVTVNSTAPTSDLITVWEVMTSSDYLVIRPDTPCQNIYISNQTGANQSPIFGFTPGNYEIRNVQLNIVKNVVIPSTFDCLFEKGFTYAVQQSGVALLYFSVVASVNDNNFVFVVTNNDLTITIAGTNAIVQYSIDGINYQDSNVFVGLPTGTTTLYVRDFYRCVKTFDILNGGQTNSNVVPPYTYISESNSLRFVLDVDHQNCGNYKNVFNTLSCEENVQIANKYVQLFQTCDNLIKTQVKTSYQNLEVYAKDTLGNLTQITANKIVSYIGTQDKRDALYYSINNKLAVMFLSGNTYDYNTLTVNGTYVLNGALPQFGTIGTWVETETFGFLQVIDIVLNSQGQKSLILNLNTTITTPVTKTIQVEYNQESYDIWEFNTDMGLFTNKEFSIGVRMYQTVPDINFPDVFWKSEKIKVKDRWPNTVEIVWFNSKNTDIYFFSGIAMKNRLSHTFVNNFISDGTIESQKTDSQVIPIDATNYFAVQFESMAITTGIARKLLLALKHDNLSIENVPYVLAENPELEAQLRSNFYKLKAKLYEAGDVWNQGTANTQTIYSNVELIGLLQGDADAEYIRVQ